MVTQQMSDSSVDVNTTRIDISSSSFIHAELLKHNLRIVKIIRNNKRSGIFLVNAGGSSNDSSSELLILKMQYTSVRTQKSAREQKETENAASLAETKMEKYKCDVEHWEQCAKQSKDALKNAEALVATMEAEAKPDADALEEAMQQAKTAQEESDRAAMVLAFTRFEAKLASEAAEAAIVARDAAALGELVRQHNLTKFLFANGVSVPECYKVFTIPDGNGNFIDCSLQEYIAEKNLHQLIGSDILKDPRNVIFVMRALIENLADMHELNVRHSDLKPENIVLKVVSGKVEGVVFIDISHMMGICTKPFASPERRHRQNYDPEKDDVYSAAVTMLMVLLRTLDVVYCRNVAYFMDGVEKRIHEIYNEEAAIFIEILPVLERMLAPPQHRPNASEVAKSLQDVLEASRPSRRSRSRSPSPRRRSRSRSRSPQAK